MGVETEITKSLGSNYVQVDVTSKKEPVRYFKVPAPKADEFCAGYKKQNRKMSIFANTLFGVSTLGGVIIVSLFTKKLKNTFLKYALCTAGGIAGGIGSFFASGNYFENMQQKFLKKFNAKEIFYNRGE